MTDLHPDRARITLQEFLALDHDDELTYELEDGLIVAMAPPSARRGRIQLNIGAALHEV